MCLDQVPAARRRRAAELEEAVRRTTLWARAPARRAARAGPAPLRDQPGRRSTAELRARSAEELVELDFDGNAIGGLAIGEDRDADVRDHRLAAAPLLPADKPRYFMGIGDPEGMLEVIEAGVDMFDCVLPTRTARTGSALTWEGRLNLRNARFARDPRRSTRAATARPARASRAPTSGTS